MDASALNKVIHLTAPFLGVPPANSHSEESTIWPGAMPNRNRAAIARWRTAWRPIELGKGDPDQHEPAPKRTLEFTFIFHCTLILKY
jgi:hypothetical protein